LVSFLGAIAYQRNRIKQAQKVRRKIDGLFISKDKVFAFELYAKRHHTFILM